LVAVLAVCGITRPWYAFCGFGPAALTGLDPNCVRLSPPLPVTRSTSFLFRSDAASLGSGRAIRRGAIMFAFDKPARTAKLGGISSGSSGELCFPKSPIRDVGRSGCILLVLLAGGLREGAELIGTADRVNGAPNSACAYPILLGGVSSYFLLFVALESSRDSGDSLACCCRRSNGDPAGTRARP